MGVMKDLLADFTSVVNSVYDEALMIDEVLYNLNLPFEDYVAVRDDYKNLLQNIVGFKNDIQQTYDEINDKLDYTE